jgi:beta-galactosidase/beta-glucuronidase
MPNDIPRPEHPRPDLRRDDEWWLNLNGVWQFEVDRSMSGEARGLTAGRSLSREILVPFCPESKLSGVGDRDFLNSVWYRRLLDVPESWRDRRVLLHVGACDYLSTAWLNGRRLGNHEGGYTPFTVELTDALKGNGRDELVIRAVDESHRGGYPRGKQSPRYESYGCHYARTTGIWQTVWLEAVPRTCVEAVHVHPEPEREAFTVQVFVRGGGAYSGAVTALAEGTPAARAEFAGRGEGCLHLELKLPECRLWSPSDPFLYEVVVELQGTGGTDRVRTWAGLRRFHCERNRFLLNGQPIFLRTVLDQGFYPDGIYTAPTAEALAADIDASLALGFNGARLHEKVFEPLFLHLCDRRGYLVFGEFADWGYDFNDPRFPQRIVSQWTEVLMRDLSHPAIIGWCPLNETMQAGDSAYGEWTTRQLHRLTKALDPSRPALDTSGYFHFETDVCDCHNYEQDVQAFRAAFEPVATGQPQKAFTNTDKQLLYDGARPYFVSEYGGMAWSGENPAAGAWGYGSRPRTEQEFHERFRGLTEALLFNPGVAGFCYTQLTDVEQEINGLMTYDRRMKFPPERIASVLRQQAAVER